MGSSDNEIMYRDDVCLLFDITKRQLELRPEIGVLGKKDKKSTYWYRSQLLELKKEIEEKAKAEKEKPVVNVVHEYITPKLSANFKFWIRNLDGSVIYRKSKDMNEWKILKKDSNVFNHLTKIKYTNEINVYEYLNAVYNSEISKGSKFLCNKQDFNDIPELSHKVNLFYKHIQNDTEFFVSELTPFTNDKDVMTYKYFDLTNEEKGEHKHWDIFEKQLDSDDIEVFRCFVYSIFYAKDKNRQVLWLYDTGNRGKTVVMNAITRFGGEHFANAIKAESLKDKHYGLYIEGYRLLLFDDNTNPFLISDSKLKSITGGGQIAVDEKGVSGTRSYMPNVKVIISSNMKPIIQNQDSDLTRLILININKPSDENAAYMKSVYDLEGVMCDELKYYLNTCKNAYNKLCPNSTNIKLTDKQLDNISNCQNADDNIIANFFNTYFEISEKDIIFKLQFDECKTDYEFKQKVKMDYAKILKFITAKNIVQKTKKIDNMVNTVYKGLKLRDGWIFDEDGRLEIC
jgi:hypothetical protein